MAASPSASTGSDSVADRGPAEPTASPIETDALIIGAGPIGLFQVFELGLLELSAHVVDSLPEPGGQCIALYADKPIYDIPGTLRCTGRELVTRLQRQIAPFAAGFHMRQQVSRLQRLPDGRFAAATLTGTQFVARTIIIAAGVGSFQPRTLKVDGLDALEGASVFHHGDDAAPLAQRRVLIVGDDDTALDWALRLAAPGEHRAASVTLVHRREQFKAAPETVAAMQAQCRAGAMSFIAGQVRRLESSADGELAAVIVEQADGETQRLPVDRLLILMGLSPKLGPIAEWGVELERKQVVVNTASFETSVPGIFAVGDINTYPGKKKLILSGFHEAALAAFGAAARVFPDRPNQLEYTTTSTRLHRVLGVTVDTGDEGVMARTPVSHR